MKSYMNFVNRYDKDGSLEFDKIKFRPNASRTTPFGIDVTTPQLTPLRIHNAIDSSYSKTTGWKIYAPFEITESDYIDPYPNAELQDAYGFGALLFLYTDYGFHLRLAHIDPSHIPEWNLEKFKNGDSFKAGDFLASCGNYGLGTGRHLHLEIVSDGERSEVLDKVLKNKYPNDKPLDSPYGKMEILEYYKDAEISEEEGNKLFEKEKDKRGVYFLNDYLCRRWDYHDKRNATFYSSMALFGM